MKKLLTLLFTFSILYSPYSHSNILYDLIGKMSPSDVAFYDKSYEASSYMASIGAFVNFKAKIKNLNQEKSIKKVTIKITTFDCKKGCKSCITVAERDEDIYLRKLLPNNAFQVDEMISDKTGDDDFVKTPGNETCWDTYIDKVEGYHIFE
mgnify:CR=1 FL=1